MRQTPTVPALRPALAALLVGLTSFCPAAEGTIVTVTGEVTVPASAINPVGVHGWGSQGPINYFAGNLLLDAGFEPQEVRAVRRVVSVGEQDGRRFIRIDEGGTSNYLQWASGAFSGTSFRAYRLEGTDGSLKGTAATAARPLGAFTIPAAESPGLPQGGWLAPMPDDYAAYRKLDGAATCAWSPAARRRRCTSASAVRTRCPSTASSSRGCATPSRRGCAVPRAAARCA